MKLIPETLEAISELDAYHDDASLLDLLQRAADDAQNIAPDLAGISVAYTSREGMTFTLVATDEEIAALDGVQYLASGPCVNAAVDGHGIATTCEDLFSEARWRAVGRAGAAVGVRSTLTFPIMAGGNVIGTVNLYGRADEPSWTSTTRWPRSSAPGHRAP